jgi:hypothetical protein
MKVLDILEQFKNIQPDADFSRHSRAEILLSPQSERRTVGSVFAFLHVIETGAAVALVGFFILILTGSFSPTRSIAPIQYAVIDPAGLHAEAQAIDMQIQLANIEYPQVTTTAAATPAASAALTKAFAAVLRTSKASSSAAVATSTTDASTSASATTTTSLSIDQALQQLTQ